MSKLTKGYGSGGMQAILGNVKTYFEGELAKKANTSDIPVITDKADKVTNATAGHLAGLDSNGNLTDSGVSPTEDVTVEGNPVTFESPFEQDAKSVVVSVKPIQDLHGYDAPWVGGAGKNLLNPTLNTTSKYGVTLTKNNDGTYILNGTAERDIYFTFATDIPINTGETYKITCSPEPSGTTYRAYGEGGLTNYENNTGVATTNKCAITLVVRSGFTANNILLKPMLTKDTSATYSDFAPYSNICPISGIDEVEIPVTGKNLCSAILEQGTIDSSGINQPATNRIRTSDYIRIYRKGNVTISASATKTVKAYVFKFDENKDYIGRVPTSWTALPYVLDIDVDTEYIKMAFCFSDDSNLTPESVHDVQIELGSTPTAYEPYNPNSHTTTIPLPSTLYDGTIRGDEGSADSRYAYGYVKDYNWAFNGTTATALYVKSTNIPKAYGQSNIISDMIPSTNENDFVISGRNDSSTVDIIVPFSIASNMEEFNTWITSSNVAICYELATPTTLSFTPADVELLEGTNVVSTNAEKVAVTYGRSLWQDIDELKNDTEDKLDKSDVATIEGDTASRAYSVNEFMLRSDGLYKVTQPIAQNASITASNTTKTTIGAVLTALLNA